MPEELNDLDALDRELSDLFAVEPPPEFAAKVRARIQQQPVASFAWRWWVSAAIAAGLLIAVALTAVGRRASVAPPSVTARADVHLAPSVRPSPPVTLAKPQGVHRVRHTRTSDRIADAPDAQVLFDPALAAAVRRLTTQQRVLPEMPPEPTLEPVVIQPLKVSEISDVTKQGDRQ